MSTEAVLESEQSSSSDGEPLLELRDVHMHFGGFRALDGVSLSISAGETVGVVGESGSGKSTIGRVVLGLERPTSGERRYLGQPYPRSSRGMRAIRRHVGIVFQDPYDSLDQRFTLRQIIDEPLRAHGLPRGDERIAELLTAAGMADAALDSYPGEYSGGQRQRIGVARALALSPDLIVCDEPTSALDVSVQAQILNLLLKLQREHDLAYLFISHDLEVVRRMSDRIVVVYAGRIVETGAASEVTAAPVHPYTRALLDAVPATKPSERRTVQADAVAELDEPARQGCAFAARCPRRQQVCLELVPELKAHGSQLGACHFPLTAD